MGLDDCVECFVHIKHGRYTMVFWSVLPSKSIQSATQWLRFQLTIYGAQKAVNTFVHKQCPSHNMDVSDPCPSQTLSYRVWIIITINTTHNKKKLRGGIVIINYIVQIAMNGTCVKHQRCFLFNNIKIKHSAHYRKTAPKHRFLVKFRFLLVQ